MSTDVLLWILAIICFGIAAFATFTGRVFLVGFGWVGLALGALTFITS